jgi:formylglycine-generating enzyme required for sulfatase activity
VREILVSGAQGGFERNCLGEGRLLLAPPEVVAPVLPSPTPLPTRIPPTPLPPTPTATPALIEGVTTPIAANKDWIPYTQIFSGAAMMLVPRGCFDMGSLNGEANERPIARQCFDEPFWIDRTEVTNAAFGDFGWWSLPEQPREVVSWGEASGFCGFRGARLPTEREWAFAARGPDGWRYPWGNSFDAERVTFGGNSSGQTGLIGERPGGASWVGALDMSGNVWEWTSSVMRPYPYDAARAEVNSVQQEYVMRGGSWLNAANVVTATRRISDDVDFRLNNVGFRCARDFDITELDLQAFNGRERQQSADIEATPQIRIKTGVNLRAGPGTDFAVAGSARFDQRLPVVGQARRNGETWYEVQDLDNAFKWVRSDFAELENISASDLPLTGSR